MSIWRLEGIAPISLSHWGVFYIHSGDAYRTAAAIVTSKKGK